MSKLLYTLLEESARRYPDLPAVKDKDAPITYRQLDTLSADVGHFLNKKGIRQNSQVGLYVDKSIDAIISIFGILKSGACYVPLDPVGPDDRLAAIIEDCSIVFLISSIKKAQQVERIITKTTCLKSVMFVDGTGEQRYCFPGIDVYYKTDLLQGSNGDPGPGLSDGELAYILYTSGSTGKPKGVMISHRSAMAFVRWAISEFQIGPGDRVASHAPFHFDLSIFDIFVSLGTGATMYLVPQGISFFPRSLAEFIEHEKISVWYSVPWVLIQLVLYGSLEQRDLLSLRLIVFAGEVFPSRYLSELMRMIPRAAYFNLYGPTETNVCTYFRVQSPPEAGASVPIGKPCEGTQIFIVDENNTLVREGSVGELYVAGPTLMDGYWKDTQSTCTVLIEDFPYIPRGQRVYRTGDFGARDAQGDIFFHGRKDSMVKIRGYRVELGEIESVLCENRRVKKAAVISLRDELKGAIIKAYIVPRDGVSVAGPEIQAFCASKLPVYMIPEIVEFCDSFPMTSTGKIDTSLLQREHA